jgi:hypothetical protein
VLAAASETVKGIPPPAPAGPRRKNHGCRARPGAAAALVSPSFCWLSAIPCWSCVALPLAPAPAVAAPQVQHNGVGPGHSTDPFVF